MDAAVTVSGDRHRLDLESHFRWHRDAFSDGRVIDTLTSKTGKNDDDRYAPRVPCPRRAATSAVPRRCSRQ
jgi:hypothetical protein